MNDDPAHERCRVPERRLRKPFIPFPKLRDALHGEPELLRALEAMSFDGMTQVSKAHAVEGIDAAREILRRTAAAPDRERPMFGYPSHPDNTPGEARAEQEEEGL